MKFPFWRSETAGVNAEPSRADFPELASADIAGVVHGQRVGGDFYQFARASTRRVLFGLLDVAGKHSENRGIVHAANGTFQDLGSTGLANEEVNEADAMMEFCLALNFSIRRAAAGVRTCAAFLGCYNEELGTVCYVNAGHTPGLLRYNSDVSELPATGMPLGLFTASTYEAPTVAVPAGGALLLVSRGVVEATRRREEFGLQRVKQQFEQTPLDNAQSVALAALQAVRSYEPTAATQNDLTSLALVRPANTAKSH
jgi:serine phosphatase RsbU (regulator of sigma subunit)